MNILAAIGQMITAIIKNPKNALLVVLIGACLTMYWKNDGKKRKIEELNAQLSVKPAVMKIYNDRIQTVVKTKDGETKYVTKYIPPEGHVTISMEEKTKLEERYSELVDKISKAESAEDLARLKAELEVIKEELAKPPEIIVKDWGFTFRPGFGVLYNPETNQLDGQLDCKFFYFKRYSALVSFDLQYGSIALSRHLDDIVPIFHNVELDISYGFRYNDTSDRIIRAGLRVNF